MKRDITIRDDDKCTMSNVLIKSKFTMSLEAQKIIYLGINKIKELRELFDKPIFISNKEFIEITESTHKSIYKKLKKAVEEITGTVIIDQQGEFYDMFTWAKRCTYTELNGEKGVLIKFNDELGQYLIDLKKHYTLLSTGSIVKLNTKYGIKLYTLLEMDSYRENFVYSVEDLRFWFGIKDGLYSIIGELRRRVIIPAIEEINQKTRLEVSFYEIKKGRRVTHIGFRVKQKNTKPKTSEEVEGRNEHHFENDAKEIIINDVKPVNTTPNPDVLESQEAKKLINLGLSKDKVNELLDNHEHDFLMYVLEQSKADTRQGINNRAGYFLSSMDNLKGVWQALKEAKIKQEEQAKEYQELKEQEENERAEKQNRWQTLRVELARDLLEEDWILFTKVIAKHLATTANSSMGSSFTDDFMEKNFNKDTNSQKTREVYQKFMQCKNRRDVSNLVKDEEPWLLRAVCNNQINYNWDTGKYDIKLYKKISDDVLPEGLKLSN